MYGYHDLLTLSVTASGPITAKRFVTYAGAVAGADEPVFGVSKTDQVAGREVSCTVIGAEPLPAAGPITKGSKVVSNAAGLPIAAPGGAVNPVGRALNDAAVGESVLVLLGR